MLRTRVLFGMSAAVVAPLVAPSPLAGAATDPRFTFTKIADTATPIPGGGGRFADFAGDWSNTYPTAPSLDHGAAVLLGHGPGFGPDSLYGVFRFDNGTLSRIADNTMPEPGGAERILSFGTPDISGGRTAFEAISTSGRSIVVSGGDGLRTVAGRGTPAPDGMGMITDAVRPVVRGDDVWFHGIYGDGSSGGEAIFRWRDGTLTAIAHSGTPVPGRPGERFTFLSSPRGDRGEVAFYASGTGSNSGLYRTLAGALVRLGDGYFPDNTAIDFDGRDTSFTGRRPIDTGYSLWIDRNGTVTRIATSGDPTPDGTGRFNFSPAVVTTSIDAGHVAFTAVVDAADNAAAFTDLGGPLTRLVGFGDRLFDKRVADVQISQDALSGNAIAFAARFSDNTSGIYLATLPEPALPALVALVLSATLLARRRKREVVGWSEPTVKMPRQ